VVYSVARKIRKSFMAKKQVNASESAAAAAPAMAAKPKTNSDIVKTRVRTVKHSKTVVGETVVQTAEAAVHLAEPVIAQTDTVPADIRIDNGIDHGADHHAAISIIAYSYWESRGYQGGSQTDDWLRAEQEYRQRSAQIQQPEV
jgi:hypothetical protein